MFFLFFLNWRDLLKRDRELHLLKRDRELEGPTNVSQKQDVLKRDLIKDLKNLLRLKKWLKRC